MSVRLETLESTNAAQDALLQLVSIDQWQAFVSTHPNRTAFHHRNWLELISSHYQMPLLLFAVIHRGQIVAGLPFIETRRLTGGKNLIALPFTDNAPALANDTEASQALVDYLKLRSYDNYRLVYHKTDCPLGFQAIESGLVRHELALEHPWPQIEKGFSKSIASNLSKARRADARFEIRTDFDAIRDFYGLHAKTRHKLGVPVQPWSFFEALYEKLIVPALAFVATVKLNDRVAAAGVFFQYHETIHYKYAASDPAMIHHRVNDFLLREAIHYASVSGFKAMDFGTSRVVEMGLRRFKAKWGAEERPVYWDCLHGLRKTDQGDSHAMAMTRFAIRRAPQWVCRGLGQALYRFSP